MNKKRKLAFALVILSLSTIFITLYGFCAPADAVYNKKFKSHMEMAYEPASFNNMKNEIDALMISVNETWDFKDLDTTYSTWWYVDQHYANSVLANYYWLGNMSDRLQGNIICYDTMQHNGSSTIFINDWFSTTLDKDVNDSQKDGGLCYAIRDAYYLEFYPVAYWAPSIFGLAIIGIAIGVFFSVIFYLMEKEELEDKERELRRKYENTTYDYKYLVHLTEEQKNIINKAKEEYIKEYKKLYHKEPKGYDRPW